MLGNAALYKRYRFAENRYIPFEDALDILLNGENAAASLRLEIGIDTWWLCYTAVDIQPGVLLIIFGVFHIV